LRSRAPTLALLAILLLAAPLAASARPSQTTGAGILKGIYDETQLLYGDPDRVFETLAQLRTKVVRTQLVWGGKNGVAKRRPERPADPADPAYDWSVYDRLVDFADRHDIKVMLSIWGTPGWANGAKRQRFAPKKISDLRNFATAAALRYSGRYELEEQVDPPPPPPVEEGQPPPEPQPPEIVKRTLGKVDYWLAWNEPSNPVFLSPQFKRVGRRYVIQSARDYARICNAVVAGVRSARAGQKIACGVTGPRGNNQARGPRPSVSPLPFLRAMKRAGARGFDAYAHHPYYARPSETPRTRPRAKTAIQLGNINVLIREVTRLYGRKPLWITEYGYETKPPDKRFGVSPKRQAQYLSQSFAIARKNPRIQMFIWFLLRDDRRLVGWQSGLLTTSGRKKPAFDVFRRLP
jgi:hypothetical protein